MSNTRRITAVAAVAVLALLVLVAFNGTPTTATQVPTSAQPHVFVPTQIDIPASEGVPAPSF